MVGAFIHKIEDAPHIQFLHGGSINQRQIHCTAARMSGMAGNVAKLNHHSLFHVWIVHRLTAVILRIRAPAHEIVHCALWAIGIIKFHKIALIPENRSRLFQPLCSFFCNHHKWRLIACGRASHEIIRPRVLCINNAVLNYFVYIKEAFRQPFFGDALCALVHHKRLFSFFSILAILAAQCNAFAWIQRAKKAPAVRRSFSAFSNSPLLPHRAEQRGLAPSTGVAAPFRARLLKPSVWS